jgi:hypothetical protein
VEPRKQRATDVSDAFVVQRPAHLSTECEIWSSHSTGTIDTGCVCLRTVERSCCVEVLIVPHLGFVLGEVRAPGPVSRRGRPLLFRGVPRGVFAAYDRRRWPRARMGKHFWSETPLSPGLSIAYMTLVLGIVAPGPSR